MSNHPVLYSFRRCPYAMRARLMLYSSGVTCELREVVLRDKPEELISISPKATVPVLQLQNGDVIDESRDIAIWALGQSDPHNWSCYIDEMCQLVEINDFKFKPHLDKYKYSSRNPEFSKDEHRENATFYFEHLETRLTKNKFLSADDQTVTDLAVFPFIRQFAFVDKDYFNCQPYPHLQKWLNWHLESEPFNNIMKKYSQWEAGQKPVYFP